MAVAGCHIKEYLRRDGTNGTVWKIEIPGWLNMDSDGADLVRSMRRQALARRDEMLAFQKQNASDRVYARFFKEEAADALKEYRAACLLLPHFTHGDLPGDCKYMPTWDWPIELAPWTDRVIDAVSLLN